MIPTREGRAPQAEGTAILFHAFWMTACFEFTTRAMGIQIVSDFAGLQTRCIVEPKGRNIVPRYAMLLGYRLHPKEPDMPSFLEKFIEETATLLVEEGIIPADKRDRYVKELRKEYVKNLGADVFTLTQAQAVARIQSFAEEKYASVN